jgi:hypothetical protein
MANGVCMKHSTAIFNKPAESIASIEENRKTQRAPFLSMQSVLLHSAIVQYNNQTLSPVFIFCVYLCQRHLLKKVSFSLFAAFFKATSENNSTVLNIYRASDAALS